MFKVLQTIQVAFILILEVFGLLEVVYLKTNLVFKFKTSDFSQFFIVFIPNLFYLITRSTYDLILFLPVFIFQYRPLMDHPFSWMIFYHHFYSTNSLHCLCSCFQNEQLMSHSHFKHRLIKHRDFFLYHWDSLLSKNMNLVSITLIHLFLCLIIIFHNFWQFYYNWS